MREFTQEEAKEDKRLLIERCFSIIEGDTQKAVPFVFRSEQNEYWKNRTLCDEILKPRKRGFSALIDAEFACACILEKNINAVVVAHREEDTKILFSRVRWMLDNLPFKVPVSESGAGHLKFSATNSHFRVITAGAADPGRGSDITHLHLSERAFYPSETFLAAVEGACVKGARRVIETTANGAGTAFHKHWLRSRRGETAYKTHFFPWWHSKDYEMDTEPLNHDHDERQLIEAYGLSDSKLAWRRQKLREMSNPDLFPQEYPSNDQEAFLVSGRMVFDWLSIQKMSQSVQAPKFKGRLINREKIEFQPGEGPLTIWSMPREDRRYVISADIAEGIPDGDWSVADVLDVSTWEQVAQYRAHIRPPEFADVLGDLGAFYNWATVVPEVNNHGLATCSRLAEHGYQNLYVREQKENGVNYGWLTTQKNKILMVNELSHALKTMDVKINSETTLEELKSFIYMDARNDMGAQAGAHDDAVISIAIAVSVLGQLRETPMTQRQRFKEAIGLPKYKLPVQRSNLGYGVRKI